MLRRRRSWVRRSRRRVLDVTELVEGELWAVRGRRELGDRDHSYIVKLVKVGGRRYICSCQDPSKAFSSARARGTCSHIGAVMLYQRERVRERD